MLAVLGATTVQLTGTHAESAFRETLIAEVNAVSDVLPVDLDGDGDVDVVAVSPTRQQITWYENDGGDPPDFRTHYLAEGVDGARSLATADLDGDGDLDVVSASSLDDTIAWYANDGASPPGFVEHIVSTVADFAMAVVAADMDGDGDEDIVAASGGDDTIAWYRNQGGSPPLFQREIVSRSVDFPTALSAADLDGDGDIDVLSASRNDDLVAIHESTGGPSPRFVQRVVSTTAAGVRDVHAADLDADGDLDLLSASYDDARIAWYERQEGSPAAYVRRTVSTEIEGAVAVSAADIDGDGDLDVLSSGALGDRLDWHESDGGSPPRFTRRPISAAALGVGSAHGIDVDGDGDTDVIAALVDEGAIGFYENTPRPEPTFYVRRDVAPGREPSRIEVEDVDGDGDWDLIASWSRDERISVFENGGGGWPEFTERVLSTSDKLGSPTVGDLDGDGDRDVIGAGEEGIVWFETPGDLDSVFVRRTFSTEGRAGRADAADLDGDGDADLIAVMSQQRETWIAWLESDGGRPPYFTERVLAEVTVWGAPIATDLNGDGAIDLIALSRDPSTLIWIRNDGGSLPAFSPQKLASFTDRTMRLDAADLDGDGDIDIFCLVGRGDEIRVWENDGATVPSFRELSVAVKDLTSLVAVDFDRDGDLDLLARSQRKPGVVWLENEGRGPASYELRTLPRSGNRSFHTVDLNGDVTTDLVAGLSWYDHRVVGGTVEGTRLDRAWCGSHGDWGVEASLDDRSWSCSSGTKEMAEGGYVSFVTEGPADGSGSVGGSVEGLLGEERLSVACRNLTTGAAIGFRVDARSWDCEREGLPVGEGELVRQTVSGHL